jgi:MFS family permease
MTLPKIYNTYFIAFVATVGGMLFGFDISSMSAIIGTKQYRDFFDEPAGIRQGAIGSSLAAGSIAGSIIAGPISDAIGRRKAIGFACLWWLVGTAVQVATNGFGSLVAGRVLNGVTVGITSSQVPVYLAELARKEKRGALIIIQQLAIGMPGMTLTLTGLVGLTALQNGVSLSCT